MRNYLNVSRWLAGGAAVCLAVGLASATPATQSASTLLILNKTDFTLALVNPSTNAVVATVPTGEGPHEVVVSTDGKFAFVSNYGAQTPGNSISMIDLAARKELRRIDVSPLARPHGLAFYEGKLYFTSETNQAVGRYDPATNKIDAQYATNQNTSHMVLISKDGKHMFTANIRGNSISVFDRSGDGWVNPTAVPVGRGPEGLDLSPDGRELWTAHSQDGAISIIDVAKKAVSGTIDIKTRRSNRLHFTPSGAHVLVTDLDAGELIVIDAKMREEIKRVTLGKMVEGILVTPDGSKAYVAEAGDDSVAVIDTKTWVVSGRIKPGKGPDGMAWVGR